MRFARSALAAAGLTVAMLNVAGPALADTEPSPAPAPPSRSEPAQRSTSEPAPAEADPSRAEPRPVPEGAPETGGGPGGNTLVPAGGILLLAGAGTGLLALRRRGHARA